MDRKEELRLVHNQYYLRGIYIGNRTNKKGYLEGLKVGIISIIIFLIISYLAFDKVINIKNIIFYFILLISSVLGSMIGINKKKN